MTFQIRILGYCSNTEKMKEHKLHQYNYLVMDEKCLECKFFIKDTDTNDEDMLNTPCSKYEAREQS